MEKIKINKNNGFAMLFTMVIVSIIMTFATGMSNSVIKQLALSSTADESQVAFYQADTAGECALFISKLDLSLLNTALCGGLDSNNNPISLIINSTSSGVYELTPDNSINPLRDPCFSIKIDKSVPLSTKIEARGYNICDPSSPKQIERGIEITF